MYYFARVERVGRAHMFYCREVVQDIPEEAYAFQRDVAAKHPNDNCFYKKLTQDETIRAAGGDWPLII